MMRQDGTVSYLKVQFQPRGTGDGRWRDADLSEILFGQLDYATKRGPEGDRLRAIIAPQQASSDLWQTYGVHGFTVLDDARKALAACRNSNSDYEFRLVRQAVSQITRELPL
jgi:hypothetical protein